MKIRIEIIEDNGIRSVYEFEREQGMAKTPLRDRIIEYLNASRVFSEPEVVQEPIAPRLATGNTLMEKLQNFIQYELSERWFTSQEVREKYETVCDDIKLSTVSTYLSRMNRDGILERKGNRNNRQYRLVETGKPRMVAESFAERKNPVEGRL